MAGNPTFKSIRRCGRACWGAMRSLSPAAVAVTLALAVGGAGIADAATGGAFILGRANSESSKATLSNSRGTPLALSAKAGSPPLAVNRTVMVKNLNAQYVGGLAAGSLRTTGGIGVTRTGANIHITGGSYTIVAATGNLPAGTYYVSATALVDLAAGGGGTFCIITNGTGTAFAFGGGNQENFVQASETAVVSVPAGGVLQERCNTVSNTATSNVYNAGIAAIRLLSSSRGT
jgi:hypothetical protein